MTSWEIYTDGSVRNNGQDNAVGGIGVYIKVGPTHLSLARPLIDGVTPTSPRSELWAFIAALRIILNEPPDSRPKVVYIHTDSEYVILAWERGRIWETKATVPPANWELIERINVCWKMARELEVDIRVMKVKAHATSHGNSMADKLASWAADHQRLSDKEHQYFLRKLLSGEETSRDQSKEHPIIHSPTKRKISPT